MLINAGSTNAHLLGLYHFTTQTNQVKETTSTVDIGFHYVAVDENGTAIDSDGDGIEDFVEDSNGNGIYDAGDFSDLNSLDSDGDGLSDYFEFFVLHTAPGSADTGNTGTSDAYKDADGDGFLNLEEFKLETDVNVPNVAAPWFDPVGGNHESPLNVKVTCPTPAVSIRYTTDGCDPTLSSDPVNSGDEVMLEWGGASVSSLGSFSGADVTLKARAWKEGWITSDIEAQGYESGGGNAPPTVSIFPSSGGAFLASDSIEILVEAADSDGTITKVQLYRGEYKIAEATNSPLRYTLDCAPADTNTFMAKAIDDDGAVTVTVPITITNLASGPVVSLFGEQPFFTSSPGTLLAGIVGVNPGTLTNLTLNGNPLVPRTGGFSLSVALVEGTNTFTLAATDNQGRTDQATTTVYLDSIAPVIAITNPVNNASFNTDRVNVRGNFTETALKQITVNGVTAFVSGNAFEALNVPLVVGTNIVTATAEDIAGNMGTNSILVLTTTNAQGNLNDPLELSATPVGGFTPLEVTFTIQTNMPGALQQVLYDFEGDGWIDFITNNLTSISHTYTNGQYFPVVTIQTSAGWFSSLGGWNAWSADRLRINVQAAPQQVGSAISITDPIDLKTTAEGHLFILSRSGATIYEYNASHTLVRSKSSIGSTPTGLDVDADGNVYVALSGDDLVAKFNPDGGTFSLDESFGSLGLIGSTGSDDGEFDTPYDVAVSPDGTEIAVSDSGNHRIQRFSTSDGSFIGTFGQSGSAIGQFNTPKGLTCDDFGYLYIADSGNNRIVLALSSAAIATGGTSGTALGQFQGLINVSVGDRGIYMAEAGNSRIQKFDPRSGGSFTPRLALSTQIGVTQPNSVAALSHLLEEKFYIADTGNDRVLLVKLPFDGPSAAWDAAKERLVAQDIPGSLAHFVSTRADGYRDMFISIGTSRLATLMSGIGVIEPVFIENETAQYYFEKVIDGETIAFPINFIKENGIWRILDF